MNRMFVTLTEILGAVALELALEKPAEACGGTFCDSGPLTMPVDQSGENILFVMNGMDVEAHIQIQYTGAAHSFAWVLPVPTVPAVDVGSQPLLTNLLAGTVPTYGYTTNFECSSSCSTFTTACGSSCTTTSSCSTTVVYSKTVGAFDVTVLSGGTAKEVSNWLSTNGYAAPGTTPALLKTYTDKSYVFVAVKLTADSGTDEIHPLVVKYPGTMPCVPLILTAEAAVDNMGVRTFFLGDDRVFPENYAEVEINDARIDWLHLGSNYDVVVTRAVDEAPKHHGFITEYAGASSIVSAAGITSVLWDATPFETILPQNVVTQLEVQSLASCTGGTCTWQHPLVLGLLHQYLPVQSGFTDDTWYSNLPANAALIDPVAWSATGFATDFDTRIVQPGLHAADLLSTYPYLTRMFTRISPSEMTEDPTFNARADLSNQQVAATHLATLEVACDGQQAMELPNGTDIALPSGGAWPPFSSDMPYAKKILSVPDMGPPVVIVDNTGKIANQAAAWDTSQNWPPPNSSNSSSIGGFGGSSMPAGNGGHNAAAGGGGGAMGDDYMKEGDCSCRMLPDYDRSGYGLAFFAALALVRRRRQARRT